MKQEIIHGDCLEVMPSIADKSIDMILCDLPYGTTACSWDTVIPFEPLWKQYKRIIKDKGAIVLTASQPFTSALVMSNIKMFTYSWIWRKSLKVGFFNINTRPLKNHEDIVVFGGKKYKPQGLKLYQKVNKRGSIGAFCNGAGLNKKYEQAYTQVYTNFPCTVLDIASEGKPKHPTQKPVALFEYLIKTYTNEGDLVLDNCAGSGTTGVACTNLKRDFILIEKDKTYFELIKDRLYKMRPEVILQMETDEAVNLDDVGSKLSSSDFDDLLL